MPRGWIARSRAKRHRVRPRIGQLELGARFGVARRRERTLVNVSDRVKLEDGKVTLPFNLDSVTANLRTEKYCRGEAGLFRSLSERVAQSIYYSVRPALPVHIRKHVQRAKLSRWDRIPFPHSRHLPL